ncbi:two component transcriptional regulator, LuxR family [Streptomyces sp. WMMB 322]|nr:response regulator transcription factor [Streptomyces sp. WMMB 322]SCK40949.1 two component transcriptional regulator, LuxR family [Streptomyces sp. WMMB 322]
MIRVLLVHDAGLLRSGLEALVSKAHDMTIETAGWSRSLPATRTTPADVCVMDTEGLRDSALDELAAALRRAGAKGSRMLALADADRPGALRRALDAGVLGFLDRNATPDRLLTGIRNVAQGKRFVDESLALAFLRASEMPLTARELAVLKVAAEGAGIDEIARDLSLSGGTVRNYMAAITRKTGARNRVDAIRISQRAGWL